MKNFTSTSFFLLLKESSQTGIDIDSQVLENGYDEFTVFLFSENTVADKKTYHNMLIYTQVELVSLTKALEKKCSRLSA